MKIVIRRQGISRKLPLLQQGFACLCLCLSGFANAQAEYDFDIKGPLVLSEALIQFSHQSGLAIVFPDKLTRNLSSKPLLGELSSDAAPAAIAQWDRS